MVKSEVESAEEVLERASASRNSNKQESERDVAVTALTMSVSTDTAICANPSKCMSGV